MIHSFQTEDAAKYGLVEAVMLNNFRYWLARNKANKAHEYDDKTWTYNSVTAFAELFPYLSAGQIRRCLDSLISQGVLVRGNYNKSSYDKTSWFAFSDLADLPNDLADLPNGAGINGKSEADIKTILKTKTTTTREGSIPENFKPSQAAIDLEKEFGVSIAVELPAFTDHHKAKGSQFKDWQAAFRTWLRNAAKFSKRDQKFQGRPSTQRLNGSLNLLPANSPRIPNIEDLKTIPEWLLEDDGSVPQWLKQDEEVAQNAN